MFNGRLKRFRFTLVSHLQNYSLTIIEFIETIVKKWNEKITMEKAGMYVRLFFIENTTKPPPIRLSYCDNSFFFSLLISIHRFPFILTLLSVERSVPYLFSWTKTYIFRTAFSYILSTALTRFGSVFVFHIFLN